MSAPDIAADNSGRRGPIRQVLAPIHGQLTFAAVLAATGTMLTLVPLAGIARIAHTVLGDTTAASAQGAIWPSVIVSVVCMFIGMAMIFAGELTAHLADNRITHHLRLAVARRLALVPLGWFSSRTSGDVKQAMQDDIATLHSLTVSEGAEMPTYSDGQIGTRSRAGFLGDKDFMETPFSTITYTEKFIADQQAQDIQSVISKTDPTVFTSGISGEALESYSIRGLSSSVNDVTVNGLSGMAGYWRTSPEMFERVDVLKGPSAMLGGMPPGGSAGGAINLVTKRASESAIKSIRSKAETTCPQPA